MTMKPFLPAAVVLAALASTPIEPSHAGGKPASRSDRAAMPVKDCTKVNGRYGYYGNPFCTPAEQLAFDRWEARKLRRQ